MNVGELDERTLIDHIIKFFPGSGKNIIAGAGEDDCAVLDTGNDNYLLVTTDMLHRKTDFPVQMTGRQIGWMSVAVNLSDIASKAGKPVGVLMSIGIPHDMDMIFLDDIIKGMQECASTYGTCIIGGDIDSHDELTISGTALGTIQKSLLIRRSGANIGDLVCVTGYLGTAGIALLALEKSIPVSQDVLLALFEPVPRIYEGIALANSGAVSSMMDISDGLALSLHDMRAAGNIGFRIYQDKLPVRPEMKEKFSDEDVLNAACYAGGDFELLFTVAPEKLDKVRNTCTLIVIGEVIKEGILIEREGKVEELKAQGYEHFRKSGHGISKT